jgi:hypothetical protein
MTVSTPTTAGQILTSAYVNNNINSGLVYIKEQAVPASGSSFTVTGAFSATYDNYRIVFTNIGGTNDVSAYMTIGGSTGSTYSSGGRYIPFTAAASGEVKYQTNGQGVWIGINGAGFSGEIDVFRPFTATTTQFVGLSTSETAGNYIAGIDSNAASSTAFTITVTGTLTAGICTVFGYRKS